MDQHQHSQRWQPKRHRLGLAVARDLDGLHGAGVAHVAPPSVERENQTRVLQVEDTLLPGSLAAAVHPVSPLKSVHET